MSYILDALRRADAERERGAVPSIHAQQFGQLPTDDEPAAPSRRMHWMVGALAALLVALLGWIFLGRDAARGPAATPIASVTPSPVTGATTMPAPAATAPAAIAPAVPAATPPRAPLPPIDTEPRAAAPVKPVHRPVRAVPPTATPTDARAATPERAPPATAPAREPTESTKVVAQRDLPPEIRSGMPTITVNGSTYSSDKASRMLMIGGQIFHEGDPVVGGVVLRQIKPRAAVFAYRGYLYEVGF